MSKRRYTDEQIRMLSHDPNIKEISPNSLRFTLAFRQKIYDAVKENEYPKLVEVLTYCKIT